MKKAIIAYIPVLHEGYRKFFERHPDASSLFVFGPEIISSYEHLVKDIRKLSPELVKKSIEAWKIFDKVEILDEEKINKIQKDCIPLVISDDDITTDFVEKKFKDNPLEKDTIFLRWDKKNSISPEKIISSIKISREDFDKKMIGLAKEEGDKGNDWWRRIGSLAVKNGKVLLKVHNEYVPSEHIAYDEGDPRGNFKSGIHLESSLAIHSEAKLMALAAKEGISLEGADVYVETFPCPPCAKQLAYSGIKRLFYRTGYNVLDGERILKSQGVEIIFVETEK